MQCNRPCLITTDDPSTTKIANIECIALLLLVKILKTQCLLCSDKVVSLLPSIENTPYNTIMACSHARKDSRTRIKTPGFDRRNAETAKSPSVNESNQHESKHRQNINSRYTRSSHMALCAVISSREEGERERERGGGI